MKLLKPEGLPVHLPRSLSLIAYLCLSFSFPLALDSVLLFLSLFLSLCSSRCSCPLWCIHHYCVNCVMKSYYLLYLQIHRSLSRLLSLSLSQSLSPVPPDSGGKFSSACMFPVPLSLFYVCACPFVPGLLFLSLFPILVFLSLSLSLCSCLSIPVPDPLSFSLCPFPYFCPCPYVHVCLYLSLSPVVVSRVCVSVPIQLPLSLWPCSFLSATVTVPLSLSISPCLCTILFFWCHSFSVPVAVPCPVTPLSALYDYQASAVTCMRFHLA